MEFTLVNSLPQIRTTDKVEISLAPGSIVVDDMMLDFPGEYEKSEVSVRVIEMGTHLVFRLVVDGKRLAYVTLPEVLESSALFAAIGDVDLLIIEGKNELLALVDEIAPSVAVTYSPDELSTQFVALFESSEKYTTKEVDFAGEITKKIKLVGKA